MQQEQTQAEMHRMFARSTNSRVWQLLEAPHRSAREDDELLYAAYASCYHWFQVGTNVHQQRGEYLIARAYMSLNNAGQALHHATTCLQLTKQYFAEMQDFDSAFANEIYARAAAMNGHMDQALTYYQLARTAGELISDAEDKSIFDADLAGGNWYGLVR